MTERLTASLGLDAPVTSVPGVSSGRGAVLSRMGIRKVRDMLNDFPRRYIDVSQVTSIRDARLNENATIWGTIQDVQLKKPRPRMELVEVGVSDDTGILICTFFRQPWLAKSLKAGMSVSVSGKVEFNYGYRRMSAPFLEVLEEDQPQDFSRIIPVYSASEKLSTGIIRRISRACVDCFSLDYDPIPLELRQRYRLCSRAAAYRSIHFPDTMDDLAQAKRRLAYEEVLLLQLRLQLDKDSRPGSMGLSHSAPAEAVMRLRSSLEFPLTGDQEKAISEIFGCMQGESAMNHMLLGDVGTGKTIVAGFALALCKDSGAQSLMMAPTEVLAWQYGRSLGPILDACSISWRVLTGSVGAAERQKIIEGLEDGSIDVLFGTHALLEDDVSPRNCRLAIIDEQQRFGVEQRQKLLGKGEAVDALYLTATPIPRSLALALYGSLTLSYLHEAPHKHAPRKTVIVDKRRQGEAYDKALEALRRGEQVYIVCPLVGEPNEQDKAGKQDQDQKALIDDVAEISHDNLAAASSEAELLRSKTFAGFTVGLLHGKLTSAEKQAVMEDFKEHKIDALVCTTVIEVGIDVPNATCMIIQDADRFGLSQLHQLRGRVGRGSLPGEVYLVHGNSDEDSVKRLQAMESTEDGFTLAEVDLSLRNEGDILGNRQHGASILKLVNVVRDAAMIESARNDARSIIDGSLPLRSEEVDLLLQEVSAAFGEDASKGM